MKRLATSAGDGPVCGNETLTTERVAGTADSMIMVILMGALILASGMRKAPHPCECRGLQGFSGSVFGWQEP